MERLRRATLSLDEDDEVSADEEESDERPWSAGADVHYDPTDLNAVVRRLVHVNEELKKRITSLKKNSLGGSSSGGGGGGGGGGKEREEEGEEENTVEALRREVDMLRIENNNVYMLRKENVDLKLENEMLHRR